MTEIIFLPEGDHAWRPAKSVIFVPENTPQVYKLFNS